jgi:alkanesulfonate monooxygenase SsuD/methylene tetrahydromethanopterin reductase-like flavin-dependent oxidoreductase (luciferase family)
VVNLPRPIQERLPILIGGGGERRTLMIAAKYADISHFSHSLNREELARKIGILKAHCKRVGRNLDSITLATTATPVLKGETFPREMVEALERSVELGVGLFTLTFENRLGMEKFVEEIIPTFR